MTSGTIPSPATRAPSPSMSAACAKRSNPTRCAPATSKRSGVWGTSLRVDRITLRLFLLGLLPLAAWTALVIVLAAALLDAPARDLLQMAVFMTVSGAMSVVAGAAFILLYRGRLLHGLRGKLLVAVLLASGLILVNVAFTAYLMFISTHDLNLLGLLMLFSLG